MGALGIRALEGGTTFHHLTTADDPEAEPPAVMAEAALMLCHRDPRTLTGRITYSRDLLAELGVSMPGSGLAARQPDDPGGIQA